MFIDDPSSSPLYNSLTDFAADGVYSLVSNNDTFRLFTWHDNQEGGTVIDSTDFVTNFSEGTGNDN